MGGGRAGGGLRAAPSRRGLRFGLLLPLPPAASAQRARRPARAAREANTPRPPVGDASCVPCASAKSAARRRPRLHSWWPRRGQGVPVGIFRIGGAVPEATARAGAAPALQASQAPWEGKAWRLARGGPSAAAAASGSVGGSHAGACWLCGTGRADGAGPVGLTRGPLPRLIQKGAREGPACGCGGDLPFRLPFWPAGAAGGAPRKMEAELGDDEFQFGVDMETDRSSPPSKALAMRASVAVGFYRPPAAHAEPPVFDCFLSRVRRGLSTFPHPSPRPFCSEACNPARPLLSDREARALSVFLHITPFSPIFLAVIQDDAGEFTRLADSATSMPSRGFAPSKVRPPHQRLSNSLGRAPANARLPLTVSLSLSLSRSRSRTATARPARRPRHCRRRWAPPRD